MAKLGTPEQFHLLREFFRSRYSEQIVAGALGVASTGEFDKRPEGRPVRDPLVRMLFAGAPVTPAELRPVLPSNVAETMAELGLLASNGEGVWCPVIIYPTAGLHMISDRFTEPDGSPFTGDREFVYFALTANTQNYMACLPKTPCQSFLDIGSGCGAAALAQARYAGVSVASDISERCSLFAEFNRRLNDIPNVHVVQGSLYEPVQGRQFDRIGAHPPYDVSGGTPWTFADGGDDGEFVIRGVIQGLPAHLAPGGECITQFRAGDKTDKPLEHRVREWLGPAHEEFDIAIVVRSTSSIEEYAVGTTLSSNGDVERYRAIVSMFAQLNVEQLVYTSVLIRRKTSASTPLTLRRNIGKQCTYSELAWMLDWEAAAPSADIWPMKLVLAPGAELTTKYRAEDGTLTPVEYMLTGYEPFEEKLACPQWIALLMSECEGSRTASDIFAAMQQRSGITADLFRGAVLRLVSAGVLRLAAAGPVGK